MTMAESIPDAIAFARSLGDVFLVVAIIGCIFTLALCACVLELSRRTIHPSPRHNRR